MAHGDGDEEVLRLRARVAELESELARSRAHVETIFANVPANFYVKDLEGRYVYGSPHGFAMFDIDGSQAIGKTDAELFPPDLAARFAASDRRVLDGDSGGEVSYAIPTKAGPTHFTGVRFVIRSQDGAPLGVCGFLIDVTRRIEAEQKLEKLAVTDPLTGVANRRRLDAHLASELARAARGTEPLSFVLCDVDHFKRFNDLYGHPRGDECLVAIAGVLGDAMRRPADLAARYGGEEFALVLPSTNEEGARALVERVRGAVRALGVAHAGNDDHGTLTMSAGVVTVSGSWTPAEVIALADTALYRAKAEGRDRHVHHEESHPPASSGRLVAR